MNDDNQKVAPKVSFGAIMPEWMNSLTARDITVVSFIQSVKYLLSNPAEQGSESRKDYLLQEAELLLKDYKVLA